MALSVYLTNACNLRCRYCFNLDRENAPRIMLDDICTILEAAYKCGNRYVSITGGEPFIYKQIFDVLDFAHDLGYWIQILSHGGLLNEEKVERLKQYWRLRIRISLDGPDRKTHDFLRGEGTFDNTMEKIDLLVNSGVNVGIGMTVSEHNITTIHDIVKLCINKGIAFLRIVPIARVKKGKAATVHVSLHESILEAIIETTIRYKKYIDLPSSVPESNAFVIDVLTTRRCMAGKLFYGITPDKKMLPCPLIRDNSRIKTVYFESEESFRQMNRYMDYFFASIKDKLGGICGTCEFREVCYGGCLAEKLSFDRNFEDEQPVCTKKILEKLVDRFDPDDIRMIVKSWAYKLKNSLEASETHACMRQAPYWSMNFKVHDRWKNPL